MSFLEKPPSILQLENVSLIYQEEILLKGISLGIPERKLSALIGPAGCGKTLLLRCFNRMNDRIPYFQRTGSIFYRGQVLESFSPILLRRKMGMIFQKPYIFPSSIYHNLIWAPQTHGYLGDFDQLVESTLRKTALWEECKDGLHQSALDLNLGQQQRLCIARALALDPEILLLDDPCVFLDWRATLQIEDLLQELCPPCTILLVTHNLQQAARVSEYTALFDEGSLIEYALTSKFFTNPEEPRTEAYIRGRK
jgi:phosphate transport system ATP-binding protein